MGRKRHIVNREIGKTLRGSRLADDRLPSRELWADSDAAAQFAPKVRR